MEKTVTFTGELQTIVLPTTGVPTFLLVFSDPILGSMTGSYEIHSIKTRYVPVGAECNRKVSRKTIPTPMIS
ncbi:MAG: hypothetical protein MZU97_00525 [Bacillus subtilis]|nr:hypothetical protein [Bacillus subtilis]